MNIHGAKKGGGKPRQPIIARDSAQSKAYISMLYGLGEGEIAGLADGYKSVYLDDTPLQNESGEFNFADVKVDFRVGTNDQEYIDGFPDVASETNVGVELKHGTPWVKSFNNLDLDAVRVRLKWGALRSQNADNGDVNGVKIDYAIDVKTDNGGWVQALATSINAKTSDAYERSHRIDLPPAQTGWQVRVRRLTPNSTSDYVSDKMYVSAITEVIDLKLRYPNTALLGLRYDAEQFSNVAKMSARCKGLIIKVPTNYDPVARTYDGLWSGESKLAYCNNPAWVYYDLCTATRYGLGGRLKEYMIDKWSLYRLAQYCDEMVDDGMGGQEPRFAVNVYIQSAEGAFELLSKLAGVFRAITYWDGNSIVVDADIPQDSIYSFSRANVIDGVFEYTGTRARDRHTVAKVAWDNPNNRFKTEYEFVRDEKAIAKFGVRVADISAWGCTSKGQAQRAGLWALKSEQLETRMVTFKVGLDGYIPTPAKVIEISDELFAGRATGGRVLAMNDKKTVITLDRAITANVGDTLVINGNDGLSQRRQIKSVSGDKVTVTKPFGDIAVENVWVLDSQDLATMKFRVLSVTADDNHQFTITAVQYNPAKYDAIDTGAYIDERPISVINPTVQAPTKSVTLSSYHTADQGISITTLVISWEQAVGAVKYQVEWRKDNGNWQSLPPTGTNSIEITGIYAGQYEARVTAISAFGQASLATHSNLTAIQGKIGKPKKLAKLTVQGVLFGMELSWLFADKDTTIAYTEIEVSTDGRSNIATLGTFAYPTNKHEITGLQGNLTQFYRARIVDKLGNVSDWTVWVSGTTSADADKVLEILSGQISESHLDQTLRTPIAKIGGLENGLNGIKGQIPSLQSAVNGINGQLPTLNTEIANAKRNLQTAQSTLNTAVANITTERNRITSAIRDITALQSANNAKTTEIANLTQTVGGHTSSLRELGVTTGDLSQKYTQIKTQADKSTSEINTIKQTQAGQATSVERLTARFDSLAVGGRNYIIQSTSDRVVGNNVRYIRYDTILSEITQPFVFSAYVKDVVGNNDNRLTVLLADKSNINATIEQRQDVPIVNGRIVAKFNTPSNPSKTSILVYANSGGWGGSATGLVTYYNAKLELGDVATDWTPAPEDVQTAIDTKASTASLDEFKSTQATKDTATAQKLSQIETAYKTADSQANTKIDSEITARTNADSALSARIDSLQSEFNGNKSSVANQLKTLSDKDSATATQLNQISATATSAKTTADDGVKRANNAQNTANTATTKADGAKRTADDALTKANTANSAITAEQKARADADSSLASRITALDASYKKADSDMTARLQREETARANADNANAQAVRSLESTVQGVNGKLGTAESKIASLERTTSDTKQALATAQSSLNARFDELAVGGRNLLKNSSPNTANANYMHRFELTTAPNVGDDVVVTLWGEMGADRTGIGIYNTQGYTELFKLTKIADGVYQGKGTWQLPMNGNTPRTPNNTHLNVYFYPHTATSVNQINKIKLERGTIATDWTPAIEDIQGTINDKASTASLDEFKSAQATKDTATAQKLSQLESNLGQKANATALNDLSTRVQNVDGKITAEAKKVNTLQTTINGHTASIQQHAQSLNGLSAQWTLKVDSMGVVSSIGLASSNGVSDFAVRANKFYIAPPTGATKIPLFSTITTPTTLNGVAVPVGNYLSDAFIQNGIITNAKIANGAITSAKIAHAQIDTAHITNGAIDNAKIKDSSITTAKIGHAQIDTLHIKGEAVIVPRLQYSPMQEFYDIDTEIEVNRVTLDAQGGAVSISFGFEKLTFGARDRSSNDGFVTLKIKRGNTVLREKKFTINDYPLETNLYDGDIHSVPSQIGRGVYGQTIFLTFLDMPPQGEQVYTVTLQSSRLNSGLRRGDRATIPVVIHERSFHLIGAKR